MESVSEEILREILLKLPTRGIARFRCVCSQWRRLLADPCFRTLHGHVAHVVAGAGAETLLVSKTKFEPGTGRNPEIVLFNNLSSTTPMCHFADLDVEVYTPANVCNGFLCLVSDVLHSAPVVVCNPITGEKLRIPAPPVVESISVVEWQFFAMGFSPSTRQYKLFRLSFPEWYMEDVYLDVYTLGDDNAGWQGQRLRLGSSHHTMCSSPVLVKGMLYVVTGHGLSRYEYDPRPDRVLAIDVASEVVRTHRLPKPKQRTPGQKTAVDALELHGRLCVAMHELDVPRPKLTFWVLTVDLHVPGSQNNKPEGDNDGWELIYSFYMDALDSSRIDCCYRRCVCHTRGAWLHDGDGVLCYLTDGSLYRYETTAKQGWQYSSFPASNKEWNHRIRLMPSDSTRWWNVYGGYRPSLLSPRHLATSSSPSLHHHHHELTFQNPLLPSKRRRPGDGCTNHQQAAKRRPTLSFLDDC